VANGRHTRNPIDKSAKENEMYSDALKVILLHYLCQLQTFGFHSDNICFLVYGHQITTPLFSEDALKVL
jgi:hypothetical protein